MENKNIVVEGKGWTVGEIMEEARRLGLPEKLKGIDTQKLLDEIDKDFWSENE